jgi:hypothetical protein
MKPLIFDLTFFLLIFIEAPCSKLQGMRSLLQFKPVAKE